MLDDFDCKLFEQGQRDNRLTANGLSETVGLSPSAFQRRLKRLRDEVISSRTSRFCRREPWAVASR